MNIAQLFLWPPCGLPFTSLPTGICLQLGEIRYLIEDLSPSIRARLLWHVHGSWLRRCRFLCCVDDPSYLWEMSRLLTSEHYNPGEYLAVQGAGIRSLSIVHVGSILRERCELLP